MKFKREGKCSQEKCLFKVPKAKKYYICLSKGVVSPSGYQHFVTKSCIATDGSCRCDWQHLGWTQKIVDQLGNVHACIEAESNKEHHPSCLKAIVVDQHSAKGWTHKVSQVKRWRPNPCKNITQRCQLLHSSKREITSLTRHLHVGCNAVIKPRLDYYLLTPAECWDDNKSHAETSKENHRVGDTDRQGCCDKRCRTEEQKRHWHAKEPNYGYHNWMLNSVTNLQNKMT